MLSAAAPNRAMNVAYASGVATSSAQDKTKTASDDSSTPSATTAATTQANEAAFGQVGFVTTGFMESSGYTTLSRITVGTVTFSAAFRILSATGAQTYAPTLATSQQWNETLVTLKSA